MELLAPISDPLDIVTKAYVDAGFMGAWSSGTAYRPSQIVSYAGNLWAANTTPLVGAVPGISGSWTRIGFVNDASGSTAGAMGSSDFTKLAGVATGAEVNFIASVGVPLNVASRNLTIPAATSASGGYATSTQIGKLDNLYTPSNSKGVAVEATNLNNLAQTGMYQTVPGCLNMPLATLDAVLMTYWFVQHYEYDQSAVSKYARQVAYPMSSGRPVMAMRNCIAGTWGAWIVTSNMPRVAAYCSSGIAFTLAAGWTTMVYQTELVDIASEYNTSTGVWVAPADAWVEFNVSINFGSPPAGMRFVIGVWNTAVEVKRICDRFTSTTGDMKWDGVAKFQAQAGVSYRVRGISTGSVPTTITCGTGDVQCFMTITI